MSLQLLGLCVGYGEVPIVHGVDLEVHVGEAVCLVGTNGAGKTTTLRGLMGLNRATSGQVMWNGEDLTGKPTYVRARRGIALVPEGRRVFPHLTVRENLEVAIRAVRGADAKVRVDAAFDMFPRLRHRHHQPAGLLSGGEQQMLAISRALVQQPTMLVIDEMSLGLAPLVAAEVGEAVKALVASGIGVLLVEQNASLAMFLCSRGYLMSGGRILLAGASEEMKSADVVERLYFGTV